MGLATREMNPKKRKYSVPEDVASTTRIKKKRVNSCCNSGLSFLFFIIFCYSQSTNIHPKNEKGTKIEEVCSDCLEKIFVYLDLNDLAVAGQVCKLFYEVAANIFFRELNPFSLAENSHRGSKSVELQKIENVLKCFGGELRSLEASSIDGWTSKKPNDKPVLDCITKYFCKKDDNVVGDLAAEDLKKLQLKQFHFDNSMVENVNILFGRLSKLTLNKCKLLDGTDQLFANCANLTKLKLVFVHTNPAVKFEYIGQRRKFNTIRTSNALDPCFNHSFPKLISFTMQSISTATEVDLDNFLSKNPQLKKLKIVNSHQFEGVIESLVKHVPNIIKLTIPAKYLQSKKDVIELKQLKKLELNFNNHQYNNVISALGGIARSDLSLESLKLIDLSPTDKLISSLVKFKTLRHLELVVVGSLSDANLQTLSETLSETQITVK